jgi:hypothetical protein
MEEITVHLYRSTGLRKEGRTAWLAIPSLGGLTSGTAISLFGAKEALLRHGISSDLTIFDGNCHVDDGRNRLVAEFLKTDADDLVFIDTDVRFDPEDLVRILLHDQDVVAGIYPLKQDQEEFPVHWLPNAEIWADAAGLIEVEGVSTGFLRIRRHVLEKLYAKVPKFQVRQGKEICPLIFERSMEGLTRWGGDYEFCRKWRDMGGKIHVDPEMTFGHAGLYEWKGSLGHHLRKVNGLQDAFTQQIVEKIAAGTETHRDIMRLYENWDNDWTVPPEEIMALLILAREDDGPIFECGTGLTTLVLGATGRPVTSLEHDASWADKIRKLAPRNVKIWQAPLIDGWYDWDPYRDDTMDYTLAVIDGPPRQISDRSGVLRMADSLRNATIFIDDIDSGLGEFRDTFDGFEFAEFGRYAIGKRKEEDDDTEGFEEEDKTGAEGTQAVA